MPAPKNLNELAIALNMKESQARSVLLHVIDFLLSNYPSEDAIESGLYHLPPYVGEKSFVEAYQETLWASYQDAIGEEIDKKMWVNICPDGVFITKGKL